MHKLLGELCKAWARAGMSNSNLVIDPAAGVDAARATELRDKMDKKITELEESVASCKHTIRQAYAYMSGMEENDAEGSTHALRLLRNAVLALEDQDAGQDG